jgi:hypothetical protein
MNNFFSQNRNIILVAFGVFMVSMTVLLFFLESNGASLKGDDIKTNVMEEAVTEETVQDVPEDSEVSDPSEEEEEVSAPEDTEDEEIIEEDETVTEKTLADPIENNTASTGTAKSYTTVKKKPVIKKDVIYEDVNVDAKSQDNKTTVWKKKKVDSNNGFKSGVKNDGLDTSNTSKDRQPDTGTHKTRIDPTKGKWIISSVPSFSIDYMLWGKVNLASL